MLKIRLMGTKNDITWFKKIMQRHPKVEVLEMSESGNPCIDTTRRKSIFYEETHTWN